MGLQKMPVQRHSKGNGNLEHISILTKLHIARVHYICIEDKTNQEPSETATDWLKHVSKGDKGDKGDKGATGPKGETGPTGSQGIPGTSQFLPCEVLRQLER